jgi:MFS family permease
MGSVQLVLMSGSAVGVLFIKALGGSDFQAMLPASLVLLLRVIQLPISMTIPPRCGKRFMVVSWHIAAALFAAAFLLPFLTGPGQVGVIAFLMLFSVALVASTSAMTFWFPMLHDLVPVSVRGRFFGKLRSIWNLTSLLVVLGAGVFLGKNPALWQFQIVLLLSILLFSIRTFIVRRIPTGRSLAGELDFAKWQHYVRSLWRERALVMFLLYYGVLGFFMGILGQPLVLYIRHLGFPASANIFIFCFNNLGMVASLFVAGMFVDRLGTKRIFFATHLVLCIVCFCVVAIGTMPSTTALYLLPLAMVVAGGMIAASGVAATAQMFHLVPDRGRAFFMSLSWIIIFAGRAISPLFVVGLLGLAGERWTVTLAGVQWDIFQTILAVTGICMLGAIVLLGRVQEVKHDCGA